MTREDITDCLSHWDSFAGKGYERGWSSKLTAPVQVHDVLVAERSFGNFPQFDWCAEGEYQTLCEDAPWYWKLNKSSQLTARLLAENRASEFDIGLIYVAASCFDVLSSASAERLGSELSIFKEVNRVTKELFRERGFEFWHHLTKDVLPDSQSFISLVLRRGYRVDSLTEVFEFVALASSYTVARHTLVEFKPEVEQAVPPKSDRAGG